MDWAEGAVGGLDGAGGARIVAKLAGLGYHFEEIARHALALIAKGKLEVVGRVARAAYDWG